jgi:Raf kinase inhibitor-like YbhB/YbcL family protein
MLHSVAHSIGRVLRPLHAGVDKLGSRRLCRDAPPSIDVVSSAFLNGQPIPPRYARDGENLSPPIAWRRTPRTAREIVLLCEDPDAPMAHPFVHWLVIGIPPATVMLPEGFHPSEVAQPSPVQGKNGLKKDGYAGPAPPPGHGVHHYHFQVFALAEPLALAAGAPVTRETVLDAIRGHILAHGELVGTYERS